MKSLLGRTLRQEVGIGVGIPEGADADTVRQPEPPVRSRKSCWWDRKRIAGLICLVVAVLLFTEVLGGGKPRGVLKALQDQGGNHPVAVEVLHSEPVNQNISPTEAIPVGSVGELVSVPGFEYDIEALSSYYQEVANHAWQLLHCGGVAEVPYFRVTMYHTPVTPEMVNENPRLGRLWEHELRTGVPIHVRINTWAALGNQSGDLLRVNEQIAFALLIAVQDYFEVPNGDGEGFPYLELVFENPPITAYRPQ